MTANNTASPALPQITETAVTDYTSDLTKILDNTRSSVVTVSSGSRTASGFVYGREENDLYIITTSDLYSDSGEVTVYFDSSAGMKAQIVGRDEATSIMLLKLQPGFEVRISRLGDSNLLEQGEYVLALSGRRSDTGSSTVSFGIVSEPGMRRLTAAPWYASVIETDAAISPDSIGGPLLDEGGAVIGMLVSYSSTERTGLAVSVGEIRLVAEELKTDGQVSRGSLGIVSRSVADLRSYEKSTRGLQLDAISGVLVTAAAEDSDLEAGDVLLQINGEEIKDINDLRIKLYSMKAGDPAELQVLRGSEQIPVSTELK